MILTLAPSDVYGPSAWYFIYEASARGPVNLDKEKGQAEFVHWSLLTTAERVLVHNEFSCK